LANDQNLKLGVPAKLMCAAEDQGSPSRIAPPQPHGQRLEAGDLCLGLADEAVAETQVLARAAEIAAELAALPAEPLRHTRRQVRGPVLKRIAHQRATDSEVHRRWVSPSGRRTVEAYVNKTLRALPTGT
jgi:enoyl-CoA hydratase/carnithine racemase